MDPKKEMLIMSRQNATGISGTQSANTFTDGAILRAENGKRKRKKLL